MVEEIKENHQELYDNRESPIEQSNKIVVENGLKFYENSNTNQNGNIQTIKSTSKMNDNHGSNITTEQINNEDTILNDYGKRLNTTPNDSESSTSYKRFNEQTIDYISNTQIDKNAACNVSWNPSMTSALRASSNIYKNPYHRTNNSKDTNDEFNLIEYIEDKIPELLETVEPNVTHKLQKASTSANVEPQLNGSHSTQNNQNQVLSNTNYNTAVKMVPKTPEVNVCKENTTKSISSVPARTSPGRSALLQKNIYVPTSANTKSNSQDTKTKPYVKRGKQKLTIRPLFLNPAPNQYTQPWCSRTPTTNIDNNPRILLMPAIQSKQISINSTRLYSSNRNTFNHTTQLPHTTNAIEAKELTAGQLKSPAMFLEPTQTTVLRSSMPTTMSNRPRYSLNNQKVISTLPSPSYYNNQLYIRNNSNNNYSNTCNNSVSKIMITSNNALPQQQYQQQPQQQPIQNSMVLAQQEQPLQLQQPPPQFMVPPAGLAPTQILPSPYGNNVIQRQHQQQQQTLLQPQQPPFRLQRDIRQVNLPPIYTIPPSAPLAQLPLSISNSNLPVHPSMNSIYTLQRPTTLAQLPIPHSNPSVHPTLSFNQQLPQ